MLINKLQTQKTNDKKVLHKVRKNWVVVSVALLAAIGAGSFATHANADTTPQAQKPQQTAQKANQQPKNVQNTQAPKSYSAYTPTSDKATENISNASSADSDIQQDSGYGTKINLSGSNLTSMNSISNRASENMTNINSEYYGFNDKNSSIVSPGYSDASLGYTGFSSMANSMSTAYTSMSNATGKYTTSQLNSEKSTASLYSNDATFMKNYLNGHTNAESNLANSIVNDDSILNKIDSEAYTLIKGDLPKAPNTNASQNKKQTNTNTKQNDNQNQANKTNEQSYAITLNYVNQNNSIIGGKSANASAGSLNLTSFDTVPDGYNLDSNQNEDITVNSDGQVFTLDVTGKQTSGNVKVTMTKDEATGDNFADPTWSEPSSNEDVSIDASKTITVPVSGKVGDSYSVSTIPSNELPAGYTVNSSNKAIDGTFTPNGLSNDSGTFKYEPKSGSIKFVTYDTQGNQVGGTTTFEGDADDAGDISQIMDVPSGYRLTKASPTTFRVQPNNLNSVVNIQVVKQAGNNGKTNDVPKADKTKNNQQNSGTVKVDRNYQRSFLAKLFDSNQHQIGARNIVVNIPPNTKIGNTGVITLDPAQIAPKGYKSESGIDAIVIKYGKNGLQMLNGNGFTSPQTVAYIYKSIAPSNKNNTKVNSNNSKSTKTATKTNNKNLNSVSGSVNYISSDGKTLKSIPIVGLLGDKLDVGTKSRFNSKYLPKGYHFAKDVIQDSTYKLHSGNNSLNVYVEKDGSEQEKLSKPNGYITVTRSLLLHTRPDFSENKGQNITIHATRHNIRLQVLGLANDGYGNERYIVRYRGKLGYITARNDYDHPIYTRVRHHVVRNHKYESVNSNNYYHSNDLQGHTYVKVLSNFVRLHNRPHFSHQNWDDTFFKDELIPIKGIVSDNGATRFIIANGYITGNRNLVTIF